MAVQERGPAAHRYAASVVWEGNTGTGTVNYSDYSRDHVVQIEGKRTCRGARMPRSVASASRHNPEDLFVAAIATCHMLVYLGLCARRGVRVLSYQDAAVGTLRLDASGGRFDEVVLHPTVEIDESSDVDVARRLHADAHVRCFIANSCSVPIRHEPVVHRAAEVSS